eukprot:11451966-Alexandrium_andersonii.AAC.1
MEEVNEEATKQASCAQFSLSSLLLRKYDAEYIMNFNNATEAATDGPDDVLAGRKEILATRPGAHLYLTKVRTARRLELQRTK